MSTRSSHAAPLLRSIYDAALAAYGPRQWWPAETDEEVVIGAVLTQNTAWKNVEKALANLRAAKRLSLRAIDALDDSTLAALIRPAGYFNLKARRLKAVARFFMERCGGRLKRLRGEDPLLLREALLEVYGVGPETADSILLYALEMPVFVIDAYTRRVLSRHGLCAPDTGYEELRALFERNLEPSAPLFNEYHALLVAVGHHHCKPSPRCRECPLFRGDLFVTRKAFAAAGKLDAGNAGPRGRRHGA